MHDALLDLNLPKCAEHFLSGDHIGFSWCYMCAAIINEATESIGKKEQIEELEHYIKSRNLT